MTALRRLELLSRVAILTAGMCFSINLHGVATAAPYKSNQYRVELRSAGRHFSASVHL